MAENVDRGTYGGTQAEPDTSAPVRDTTRSLVESIMRDVWPRRGAIVDIGLDSQGHHEALYYLIREGETTPAQLDAAVGKGDALTALARPARRNPHKEVRFRTYWGVGHEGLGHGGFCSNPPGPNLRMARPMVSFCPGLQGRSVGLSYDPFGTEGNASKGRTA
jgi:hypothetical protein